ncbi:MAG: hypothetical protein CVU59_11810, partial [Deltaproteobacteria bacterium HGW-Deltaproteobacteria-17]
MRSILCFLVISTLTVGGFSACDDGSSKKTNNNNVNNVNNVTCGDGQIEGAEVCDGTALGTATCATQGFDGGELACATDCTAFDTTGCSNNENCGNNTIEDAEVCDGTDLGTATCISQGFEGGTLACAANCGSFDTSS